MRTFELILILVQINLTIPNGPEQVHDTLEILESVVQT